MAGKKLSGVHVSWPRPSFTLVVRTNKEFRQYYHAAMMYAHYELSSSELKKEVLRYLRTKDPKHPLLERISGINENRFVTVGKYMYIENHGGQLPEDIAVKIIPALEKVIEEEETKTVNKEKVSTYGAESDSNSNSVNNNEKVIPTIQDRLKDKAHEIAGEVEGWIDDFCLNKKLPAKSVEDFVNLFKSNDLKSPHMRFICQIFERRTTEISIALSGKDKDIAEGYSNFSKSELKKLQVFYANLIKASDMFQEVAKVAREPRKKKPVSHDKAVSKLKYKKEDSSLGIVSINPINIIGSKEVWVYNTKTRKITQYKALDVDGMSVKGGSLLNYSPDSVEKTVRKPAETLAEFKKASKVKLRTFMKDLTTVDIPAGGKLNEHHVILRIDK